MNNKEHEIISEVLVAQEKQIDIDAIQIVEKSNVKDKEKFYEMVRIELQKQRKRIISCR